MAKASLKHKKPVSGWVVWHGIVGLATRTTECMSNSEVVIINLCELTTAASNWMRLCETV